MALSTIGTAAIADDAITAAKIDDDGTGFTFGDINVTGASAISNRVTLDGSSVATVTVNGAVSGSTTVAVDGVSGTIAVGMVVNVSDTTVRSITDASSESAISVDDTLTITAVASQTSFTVSEAVSIADNVVLILRADENSKMVLDASADSTDVGEEILFEDATGDGSITTDNFSTNTGIDQKFAYTLSNTVAATSDGGAVTQNLVQGLCKAWLQFNQTTPAITDSLNIGSVTDTGAGDFTPNYTNAMSGLTYAVPSAGGMLNTDASGRNAETNPTNTSSYQCTTSNSGGTKADYTGNSNATFGDLA